LSTPAAGTIAVTGGTGFVGRAVIRELSLRGYQINALTRRDQSTTPQGVTWIPGDLETTSALDRLLEGADVVVHIAGLIKARSTQDFFAGNEAGTRNLLNSIERVAAHKPVRLVHVSTIAAREPHLSPYAASKAAGEAVIRSADDNVNWTILRPPAVYGPEDTETLLFFQLAGQRIVPIPGSQSNRVALIHVEDLARAIADIFEGEPDVCAATVELDDGKTKGYALHEIFDLIAPEKKTRRRYIGIPRSALLLVGALAAGAARLTGRVPMLTPGKARELCHPGLTCDNDHLSTLSSWRPKIEAKDGLPATLEWYETAGYL